MTKKEDVAINTNDESELAEDELANNFARLMTTRSEQSEMETEDQTTEPIDASLVYLEDDFI